jgi:DNA-binding transcriptional regulator YdaS (Cro superfamily)
MDALSRYITANDMTQVGFARQLGISDAFLSQILSGVRKPGVALTKRIEAVTGIPRIDLRPDIFGDAQ